MQRRRHGLQVLNSTPMPGPSSPHVWLPPSFPPDPPTSHTPEVQGPLFSCDSRCATEWQGKGCLSYTIPSPSSVCQLDRTEHHPGDCDGVLDWVEVGRYIVPGSWRLQHSMVWIARLDGKEAGDPGTVTICFLTAVTM